MDASFVESNGRMNKFPKKSKKKRRTLTVVSFNKPRSFNTSLNSTFVKASLRSNNRALAKALESKKAELQYAQQIIYCLEEEVHKYREALTESRALVLKQKEDFAKVDKIVRQLIEFQSQYIDDLATAHDVCSKVMAVEVDKWSVLKSGFSLRPRCKQKPARVLNQAQCTDTPIQPNKTPDPKPEKGSSDTDLLSPTFPVLSSPTEKELGSLVSSVCEQGIGGAPIDLSMIAEQSFLQTLDARQNSLKDTGIHNPDLLFMDKTVEHVGKRRRSSRLHSQRRDPLLVGTREDLGLSPLLKQYETSEALESVSVTDQQQVSQPESVCQDEGEERKKHVLPSNNVTVYDILDMELTHVEHDKCTMEEPMPPESSSEDIQDVMEIDDVPRGTSDDKDKESLDSCDALKMASPSGKEKLLVEVEDNQATDTSTVTEETDKTKKQGKTVKKTHLPQPKKIKSSVINIKMAKDQHRDSSTKAKIKSNSIEHTAEGTDHCTEMLQNSNNNSDGGNGQKKFTAYMVKPGMISFTLDRTDVVNPKGSQSQRKPRSKSNSLLPMKQRSSSKPRSKSKSQTSQPEQRSSEVMSVFDIDFSTPRQQQSGKMTSSSSEAKACLSSSACKIKPSYSQFCGRELPRPRLTIPTMDKSPVTYESPHGIMLLLGDGRRSRSKPRSKNVHYKTKLVTVNVISPEKPVMATPEKSDDQFLTSIQPMSENAGSTPLRKAALKRTITDVNSLDDVGSGTSSRKRHMCSPVDSSNVDSSVVLFVDDSPVVCRPKRRHALVISDLEESGSEAKTPTAMKQRAQEQSPPDSLVAPNPPKKSRSTTRQMEMTSAPNSQSAGADKPVQAVQQKSPKTSKPVDVRKDDTETKSKSLTVMDQGTAEQSSLKVLASPVLTRTSRSKMRQKEMTSCSKRTNAVNQTSPAGAVQEQSSQTPKPTDVRKGKTKKTSISQKVADITNTPHRDAPSPKNGKLTIISNTEPGQTEEGECHPSRKPSLQFEKETGGTEDSKAAGQGHDTCKEHVASENCQLLSTRPRRISSQVKSYKEISLNKKLRQEDVLASTIYRGPQGPELIKLKNGNKKKVLHKSRMIKEEESGNNNSLNTSRPLTDVTNVVH